MKLPRPLQRSVVASAFRGWKHPAWEVATTRDLVASARAWRRAFPRVPRGRTPRVLVYTWRDDVFDAKLLALVAHAAASCGAGSVAAVDRWTLSRAKNLFRAISPSRVVVPPAFDEPLDEASEHLLRHGSLDDVESWTVGGIQLGEMVVSSAVRELRDADPELVLAERDRLVRLGRRGAANLRKAHFLLARFPTLTHVVCNEPGYIDTGPLCKLALDRGLQVVYPSLSSRDDALLFKRYTGDEPHLELPMTLSRSTWERASAAPWTDDDDRAVEQAFRDRYGGRWSMSKTFQPAPGEADAPLHPHRREDRPLVVVFCHVLWDATSWAGDDLYASYADWLVQTVRVACQTDDVDWIVKAHPANAFRTGRGDIQGCGELRLLASRFERLPDHVSVMEPSAPVSSLALYQRADVGITVRGMPGFEMACFGKRVLTAGTGPYDRLGFTDDFATVGSYEAALRGLGTLQPVPDENARRARRYALTLLRDRPFVLESFTLDLGFTRGERWTPLDRNLWPREGARHDDLEALGRWLLQCSDADWITPWHRP